GRVNPVVDISLAGWDQHRAGDVIRTASAFGCGTGYGEVWASLKADDATNLPAPDSRTNEPILVLKHRHLPDKGSKKCMPAIEAAGAVVEVPVEVIVGV